VKEAVTPNAASFCWRATTIRRWFCFRRRKGRRKKKNRVPGRAQRLEDQVRFHRKSAEWLYEAAWCVSGHACGFREIAPRARTLLRSMGVADGCGRRRLPAQGPREVQFPDPARLHSDLRPSPIRLALDRMTPETRKVFMETFAAGHPNHDTRYFQGRTSSSPRKMQDGWDAGDRTVTGETMTRSQRVFDGCILGPIGAKAARSPGCGMGSAARFARWHAALGVRVHAAGCAVAQFPLGCANSSNQPVGTIIDARH